MFISDVKIIAKNQKVLILFDMDGTCVQYGTGEKQLILDNFKDFYLNKRPIKTVIKEMKKFSKIKNVEVGILSNCYYKEQKQDKLKWIEKYLPFIKQKNKHIIVYSEINFEKENKSSLKADYIDKNLQKQNLIIYLIEDQHDIIKVTNKQYENMAHHISEIIP